MKKRYTIGELKEYLTTHKPNEITYISENQLGFDIYNPTQIRCAFPVMQVFENPNSIMLSSGGQHKQHTIIIRRLKFVEIETGELPVAKFSLFCETFGKTSSKADCILIVA